MIYNVIHCPHCKTPIFLQADQPVPAEAVCIFKGFDQHLSTTRTPEDRCGKKFFIAEVSVITLQSH